MINDKVIIKILDLGRWAPSGDNTQPWRFELIGPSQVAVHGTDTRDWCVYDFDGHASHMAHGALLETLRIAGSGFGLSMQWTRREGSPDEAPIYDLRFEEKAGLRTDSLFPYITERTVQRRRMQTRKLTSVEREALSNSVGSGYTVQFLETAADRRRVARLLWKSAHIRLTSPEAYETHRRIIDWGARYSEERIPEQAVGVDPLTGKLMQWTLASWDRADFMNRYLGGTLAPRVMLDVLPGLCCAAHVLIRPEQPLKSLEDFVEQGRAMQRFWLTATQQELMLQPEMTPLIFRWYARHERVFSATSAQQVAATHVARDFEAIVGASPPDDFGFFCRVGESDVPRSRSLRLGVDSLLIK